MTVNVESIRKAIVERKKDDIDPAMQKAISEGADIQQIMDDALIGAMDDVGDAFSKGEIFIPEMLFSATLMKKALEHIKPMMNRDGRNDAGTVLMCTVKGDLHDIGKNIVIMNLEGAGLNVIDLGIDISEEIIAEKVAEFKPDVLGLSALLTTTMSEMKKVIGKLKSTGLRETVKIVVGGAPLDQKFADEIGADGYCKDSVQAVSMVRQLLGKAA